jgi:hypothetical protein
MSDQSPWWAKGTLFENCNCQIVCPGHFHFSQLCTHERCIGYWGIDFDEGQFQGVDLAGVKAVVVFDCPQHMVSGDWIITTYVDQDASDAQAAAVERILDGSAEGPWKVLGRFVSTRNPLRRERIVFTTEPKQRAASVGDFLKSLLTPLKGRDRSQPVTLENNYNQIHNPRQELGMGSTSYDDGVLKIETKDTHALESRFSWAGTL